MQVLSAAQSRELDRCAIEDRGIAGSRLMSHAGSAVARIIERDYPQALAGCIGILCGGGNNGGDGLVVARWLRDRQVRVRTLVFAPPERLRGDAAAALAQLRSQLRGRPEPVFIADAAAWASERQALFGCDLIVDAIFGTGLVHAVKSWIGEIIADVNRGYSGPVVSIDVPSGMGADGEGPAELPDAAVVRACQTITFTTPKRGHYLSVHADRVGKLEVVPIGIPDDVVNELGGSLRLTLAADCRPYIRQRSRDAHKGKFGHVLVVAGSLGKSGAAVLVSTAALRIGAGLVTAAVPRSVLPIVAAAQPELMTEPLPETDEGRFSAAAVAPERLEQLLRPATVLALGPGVTQALESAELVRHLVRSAAVPCVLDADGLNAFAGRLAELRFARGGILTPHPGEMARLFAVSTADVQTRRLYYAQRLAAETGAVAVLKGRFTLIADPDGSASINSTGNPGMSTAGSGDVLTGMLAGLLGQFPDLPLIDTAAAGVYIHGRCGDTAAGKWGEMPMLAGDLIAALPEALAGLARA